MAEGDPEQKKKSTIFGGLGILGVLALKFKFYIFAGLKALSLLKIGWLFSSMSMMILSIGLYTLAFGWVFGLSFVVLIFIHEMGHWIWMKATGLNPKAPMFVPGFGAFVAMQKLPPDQATRAWVAYAGPLIGSIGAAGFYWVGIKMASPALMAAGSTGFWLNLLQLVPAKPLDGGFIIAAISKWLLIPGTIALIGLSIVLHSGILMIVVVISVLSLIGQFSKRAPVAAEATPASIPQRVGISLAYLALVGLLAYLYWLSHSECISMLPHHTQ